MAVDKAFASMMVGLATALGVRLSPERIRMYATALSDIPNERLQYAFSRALTECRFFPQPAELRNFVGATGDDLAILAWNEFESHASKTGAYQKLIVEDACAANAMVSVFGSWPKFCESCGVVKGLAWHDLRQAFLAAYRQAQRTVTDFKPVTLHGLSEQLGTDKGMAGTMLMTGTQNKPKQLGS